MTSAGRGLGALAAPALAGLAVVSVLLVAVSDGNPLAGLAPLLSLGFLYLLWRLPLRVTLTVLVFLIFAIDSPFEVPHAGMWEDPLMPLARLLYDNLHKVTGISVLRFSGLDLLLLFLVFIALYRKLTGSRIDPPTVATPRVLKQALFVSFAAVVFLEVMGILRGGNAQQSLWQMRQIIFIPVVGALYQLGLQGPRDLKPLGMAILAAALFKVFLGAYFLYFVAHKQELSPPYVTNHTDSELFVAAIMVVVTLWMEDPRAKHFLMMLLVVPVVLFGIVINDRRLAYVSLAACLITVFLMMPMRRSKRFLLRTCVLALPLMIPYVAIGWSAQGRVFKPVQVIKSVVDSDAGANSQADSSTEFRNMENYNLYRTWLPNPLLGSGFGHEYNEVILLPDISRFFPAYRYVPHNSILWLWGIGGYVGFSAMWMFLVIGVFMMARAYPAARTVEERTGALVCLCIVVSFLNQAFGDMGTQSFQSVFFLAPAVVMGGKLAVASGVWPAPQEAPRRFGLALLSRPRPSSPKVVA